jgi:hypothetical protein
MSRTLFRSDGGALVLPDAASVLCSRLDGGNLQVLPPRPVWERNELSADELTHWSFLVAAAGAAMLDALPQLEDACINYWEAGNWAMNAAADPVGPKYAYDYRQMHLHLLGRSRTATHPSWRWGESPRFPEFAERHAWSAGFERLTADECRAIVKRTEARLASSYGVPPSRIAPWHACPACAYPTATEQDGEQCRECATPT